MQIPSESFEALGYCLLSVKSIDNKYCICEIDVSGVSDTISDCSSNVLSISDTSSFPDTHADLELDLSVSDIDFNIDISDIDILDIDILDFETYYTEDKCFPNIMVEIHEEKNIVDTTDFYEFCRLFAVLFESFVFEEALYLFDIFG